MQDSSSLDKYNDEPVFYCKHCLSLKIMNESLLPDLEYCGECGSTNVETTDIASWERMYEERYGFKLLDKKSFNNGREQ